MNIQEGIAPIVIIALVVLVGGGTFALIQRSVLKEYFAKGDKPAQEKMAELDGTFQNGDISTGEDFASLDKPAETDFADTIDSSLNLSDDGLTAYKTAPVVLAENKKEFSLDEKSGAVTFRWTPVVPKPKEAVTYRLKVW